MAGGTDPNRPRAPGVLHAAFSLVIALVVASLTLTNREPPPPSIAEFAPQANERIQDAPQEQAAGVGTSGRDRSSDPESRELAARADSAREVIDVARVRRCVGDPPRQIEDPQSPPCVPHWEGDNGARTSKGVTRNEIRVAVPSRRPVQEIYQRFFNSRFEFYGRRITLVDTLGPFFGSTDPEVERAHAQDADAHDVFAALEYPHGSTYYEELARRGIVSGPVHTVFTEKNLAKFSPHIWQYEMALDRILANVGDWICSRLAGRTATYTTDPVLSSEPRVFGLVFDGHQSYRTRKGQEVGIGDLEGELARCDESLKLVFHSNEQVPESPSHTNEMLQMQSSDVSTIICMCHSGPYGYKSRAATSQGYFPEWILTNYWLLHSGQSLRTWGQPEQLAHTFGVFFDPRWIRPENQPARWAIAETDPSYYGTTTEEQLSDVMDYRNLLLLASGFQTAGPNLTPETFRRGLHRTVFPNPDHPIMAGDVGFAGGHSMTQDGVEWWWSNSARGPHTNDARGTICYVGGGVRHRKGSWPAGDGGLFEGPCDSGL